jgi:hypothetical protein
MFSKAIRISTKGTSVILSVELVNSYVTWISKTQICGLDIHVS